MMEERETPHLPTKKRGLNAAKPRDLVEALALPGLSDVDFDPPRMEIPMRAVDLT
jgi:hypothetical protein